MPKFRAARFRRRRWSLRRILRLVALVVLLLWLLPVEWAFWPPLELNQTFAHRVAPLRNAYYRLEDPVRRLLSGYAVPDTLPVLRFTLTDAAEAALYAQLDTIRARGVNVGAGRQWQTGTLQTNARGGAQLARITWHGKFQNHWLGRQRSLKVKLPKGAVPWWGLREFTLLTPDNRDLFGPAVVSALAARAGVWHPRTRLVRVELNGSDLGLYWAEEPIDARFLAARGLPGGVLLAPRAAWADDFPDHRRQPAYGQDVGLNRGAHAHALALEAAFQEVESATSSAIEARALGAWASLSALVTATNAVIGETAADPAGAALPDSAAVAALFEVRQWAAADALRHLLADEHNLAFDNLHVVFDPATGRFQPIYRFEGGIVPATRASGLTNAATLRYNRQPLPLWLFINRHPTLRLAKLRALHALTATSAPVEAALQAAQPAAALVERAPGAEFPVRQRRWKAAKIRAALRANRALICQSLSMDAWLYGTIRRAGDSLQITWLPEAEGVLRVCCGASCQTLLTRVAPVSTQAEGLVRTVSQVRLAWPVDQPVPPVRAWNVLTEKPLPGSRVRIVEMR